jgi:hypothetical protein
LLRGPTSLIDKKTAQAIGLIRPHITKSGVPVFKTHVTSPPSNMANNPGNHGKTVTGAPKTAFTGNGRFGTVFPQSNTPIGATAADLRASTLTRGDYAIKGVTSVSPLATQPRNAAINDAILNGTGVKRPIAVLTGIGGAMVRKPAAVINGTDIHAKPH